MNITGGKGAEEDLSELLENIPSLYGPRSNSSTNIESAINDESTVDSLSTSEHNNGNLGGNLHLKDIYNHTSSYSDGGEEIDPWSKSYVGISINYFSVGIMLGGSTSILYPMLVIRKGVSSSLLSASTAVVTIFWSYKILFGFLSDCAPILGY
mmetsp:Transcript_33196/g.44238  ORF Transcript_33196/g.44238 Transcript_33196/m.44238 type:complete len:153 (+) Transcript_33196:582-1040(+)